MIYDSAKDAVEAFFSDGVEFSLFNGDCFELLAALPEAAVDVVVTSPPYFMGKSYDTSYDIKDFIEDHIAARDVIYRSLKEGGNIAWQVGHHVRNGKTVPLDFHVYGVFNELENLHLRNRIVWTFNHGLHSTKRFSGRHETILWFTKGEEYYFDLDSVRVPQKYPGKRHYNGPKKGQWSGNPLGKNPGDVWEIPNVKANHPEKTGHPCQFPISLAERLIRGFSPDGAVVLDPFAGSGTTGVAAVLNGRRFIGAELNSEFCRIAEDRYQQLKAGTLRFRPDNPVFEPTGREAVSIRPEHFVSGDTHG